MSEWKLTVGMEIHLQLKTKTKMFCGCKNDPFNSPPNTNICPVCYGLPGALPLLNKEAVKKTVELGQALNGKINEQTFWARKNYFYPDLPKGYQISQSTAPVVGEAEMIIEGEAHQIERIHLEEDAGKLMHQAGKEYSLVNYNRAGTPLVEMVTRPDFHSAADAKRFCQELQRIARHLDISDADMEKGQMRCEANISVSKDDQLGQKVEVKNINSFRSVEKAIEYEFKRQVEALEDGGKIDQETRTWNDPKGETVSMRSKETSADYRYFPEPDLPNIKIDISNAKKHKLPDEQRDDLKKLGVPADIAQVIVDKGWFDSVLAIHGRSESLVKDATTTFIDIPGFANLPLDDQQKLLEARKIAGWTKETFAELVAKVKEGDKTEDVITANSQSLDLAEIVEEILKANSVAVTDFKAGKEASLNFLVGQVMAKTKGRANIQVVRDELKKALQNSQ